MRRIADTSFLYTAFDESDARHQQARDELAKPQTLEIPLPVLSEFLGLLEYRRGRDLALTIHSKLMALATVDIVSIQDESLVLDVWANHSNVSIFDASAVVACLETKGRLLSYDGGQAKVLASLRAMKPSGPT